MLSACVDAYDDDVEIGGVWSDEIFEYRCLRKSANILAYEVTCKPVIISSDKSEIDIMNSTVCLTPNGEDIAIGQTLNEEGKDYYCREDSTTGVVTRVVTVGVFQYYSLRRLTIRAFSY